MTRFSTLPSSQQLRLEEAALWLLRLQDDPACKASGDFLAWVADAENAQTLQAVDEGWRQTEAFSAMPELLGMRKGALARARRHGLLGGRRWRIVARAAAVLLMLALAGGGAAYVLLGEPGAVVTDIGERRVLALPDGSRLLLDSDTTLRVRYTQAVRRIDLLRGRARFDVAHDKNRPFSVVAGDHEVIAVGTNFNVERLRDRVIVTLIHGKVVVKSETPNTEAGSASRATTMHAGDQLVAVDGVRTSVSSTDLQTAVAWENGRLIFDNEPLGRAIQRVNRYTDHPVSVAPDVAGLRISGVFNAGDVGAFVGAVTAYFPISATSDGNKTLLAGRRKS